MNKAIGKQLKSLERRIAKLEKAAVLFEEHRQVWIAVNKGLAALRDEMKRDERRLIKHKLEMANSDCFARISRPVKF